MDEVRMVLAAATGAVIGGIVVVALSWTLRAVARPAGPEYAEEDRMRRAPSLHWTAKAAIVLLSIGAYGYLGYANRPLAPAAPPVIPQATPADFTEPTTQFAIGGVGFRFAPPSGYCLYPPALLGAVVAQQAKLNPDNVIHTVFADCDELRQAASGNIRIRDFGMLMTPKTQLDASIGPAELDQIVAGTVDPASVKETLDQRLRDAQSRLTLQSFSSLGLLDRDSRTAYFAYLFKANDDAGGFNQACVMGLTTMKDRLVSYYLYSDYSRDAHSTLNLLLQKVKAGLGDLADRNS
jgi:hypothetical protein